MATTTVNDVQMEALNKQISALNERIDKLSGVEEEFLKNLLPIIEAQNVLKEGQKAELFFTKDGVKITPKLTISQKIGNRIENVTIDVTDAFDKFKSGINNRMMSFKQAAQQAFVTIRDKIKEISYTLDETARAVADTMTRTEDVFNAHADSVIVEAKAIVNSIKKTHNQMKDIRKNLNDTHKEATKERFDSVKDAVKERMEGGDKENDADFSDVEI